MWAASLIAPTKGEFIVGYTRLQIYCVPKFLCIDAKRKQKCGTESPVKTCNLHQAKGKILLKIEFKGQIASKIQFRSTYCIQSDVHISKKYQWK